MTYIFMFILLWLVGLLTITVQLSVDYLYILLWFFEMSNELHIMQLKFK